MTEPVQDPQTVTSEGEVIQSLIDGVRVRRARTITDARGTLCEMYSEGWEFTEEPVVHVYHVLIRPGVVKGWVLHKKSDDRLFFDRGTARLALYDAREGSPTEGMVNELFFDDHNRGLVRIPHGVYHAVENVGIVDAVFINMPTIAYDHEDPDKFRLPIDTPAIPFKLRP